MLIIFIILLFIILLKNNIENFNDDYMVIKTNNGLCNRLQVIFSYNQLASEQNKKLYIIWNKSKACNNLFNNVSSCDDYLLNLIKSDNIFAHKIYVQIISLLNLD